MDCESKSLEWTFQYLTLRKKRRSFKFYFIADASKVESIIFSQEHGRKPRLCLSNTEISSKAPEIAWSQNYSKSVFA